MIKKIKKGFNKSLKQELDVIVHIGAPKTGTSAIQDFLLDFRKDLENIGFYYPLHGKDINNISGGHSNIGLSLINEDYKNAKYLYDNYLNEAKKKNLTLILSAESFYNHAAKFKKIVGDESIKIIAFNRDPLDSLFSNYNQGVKRHFWTNNLAQHCKNMLVQKQILSLTGGVTEKWKEYFGIENVEIQKYDKELFSHVSIQEIFLESVGMSKHFIERIKPKNNKIVNKSYSTAALEFKRVVNYVLDRDNAKSNNELDWYLQSHSDKVDERVKPYFELPNDIISSLEEKFATKVEIISLQNSFSYSKRLQNILLIVESIKEEKPELYSYISKCIEVYIASNKTLLFDIKQLCGWFDIYVEFSDERSLWFSQNILNNMAEGNFKESDFLREIASLLQSRGDEENAYKIITKALELRPKGKRIKDIYKKLKQKNREC